MLREREFARSERRHGHRPGLRRRRSIVAACLHRAPRRPRVEVAEVPSVGGWAWWVTAAPTRPNPNPNPNSNPNPSPRRWNRPRAPVGWRPAARARTASRCQADCRRRNPHRSWARQRRPAGRANVQRRIRHCGSCRRWISSARSSPGGRIPRRRAHRGRRSRRAAGSRVAHLVRWIVSSGTARRPPPSATVPPVSMQRRLRGRRRRQPPPRVHHR